MSDGPVGGRVHDAVAVEPVEPSRRRLLRVVVVLILALVPALLIGLRYHSLSVGTTTEHATVVACSNDSARHPCVVRWSTPDGTATSPVELVPFLAPSVGDDVDVWVAGGRARAIVGGWMWQTIAGVYVGSALVLALLWAWGAGMLTSLNARHDRGSETVGPAH